MVIFALYAYLYSPDSVTVSDDSVTVLRDTVIVSSVDVTVSRGTGKCNFPCMFIHN